MIDITREVEDIYNDFGNTLVNIDKPFALSTSRHPILGSCNKSKGIYKVTLPKTGDDGLDLRVKMHEYGHLKCGHLEGIHEDMDANLRKIIINKDEMLVKAINEKCGIDYADTILDKVISDPTLNHMIHNISMDMEVNSSVLDESDINCMTESMNKLIYDEYMRISENGTKKVPMDMMNNLYAKFDMKFIHPSIFGFPSGLTYPDYLVQCILNLDKVMNTLSDNYNDQNKAQDRLDQQGQQGQGQGKGQGGQSSDDQSQQSQGQGSGSGQDQNQSGQNQSQSGSGGQSGQNQQDQNDQNDNDNNQNSNMPKTREEFEQMMENMRNSQSGGSYQNQNDHEDQSPSANGQGQDQNQSDQGDQDQSGQGSDDQGQNEADGDDQTDSDGNDGEGSDDQNQDGQGDGDENEGQDQGEGDNDHGTDSRAEADDKRLTDLGNYASPSSKGIGSDHSTTVRNYQVNNDPLEMHLQEIIRECRHKVIKRDFAKDMVHKYNRKILGRDSKMLSPTYKQKITKSENPTVVFVIDVSGSMDDTLVDRCITTIRNQMKRLDRALKYNVIAWDTHLCEYYKGIDFNSPIPKLRCCGGTALAGSFDLFKKDFNQDAIMILISDFEDYLDKWHEKEKTMNGYSMYGLCYGPRNMAMPKFKNFKVRFCETQRRSSW